MIPAFTIHSAAILLEQVLFFPLSRLIFCHSASIRWAVPLGLAVGSPIPTIEFDICTPTLHGLAFSSKNLASLPEAHVLEVQMHVLKPCCPAPGETCGWC